MACALLVGPNGNNTFGDDPLELLLAARFLEMGVVVEWFEVWDVVDGLGVKVVVAVTGVVAFNSGLDSEHVVWVPATLSMVANFF